MLKRHLMAALVACALFPLFSSGQCNDYLRLSNYSSYVQVGNLHVTGNQLTVEAKFSRTTIDQLAGDDGYSAASQGGDLVSKHRDMYDCNYLLRPYAAQITTENGFFQVALSCQYEVNKTYHIAMVYDGSFLRVYRNGALMGQTAATGNLLTNGWNTTIGYSAGQNATGEQFLGYINEVRIWNVARTQNDLRANMSQQLSTPASQTGLLAYYTFNSLLNRQGNTAWNGQIVGTGTAINQTNPTCPYFDTTQCVRTKLPCDSALRLRDSGDAVNLGNLSVSGNKLTVEAVFTRTTAYTSGSGGGSLVSKHSGATNVNYLLRPNFCAITTSTGFYSITAPCEAVVGQSYHVAMVYDGSTLRFYRNNQLMGSAAVTGTLVTNLISARIGADAYDPNVSAITQFVGYIREVRIWNVARTIDELMSYNTQKLESPGLQTGLLGYYRFGSLANRAPNGNWNGTLRDSATIGNTVPNCQAGVLSGSPCIFAARMAGNTEQTATGVKMDTLPVTDQTEVLQVYPVPLSATFTVQVKSKYAEMAVVSLVNQSGVRYQLKRQLLLKGDNKLTVARPGKLAGGVYYLVIRSEKQHWTRKVMAL